MDRKVLVICVVVGIVLFAVGILIGHFGIKRNDGDNESQRFTCDGTAYSSEAERYKNSYLQHGEDSTCYKSACNEDDLPRTYIAYHLSGATINMDGKLDDPAWEAVPWTDTFLDIRGPDYPKPKFDTKVKVRWDDTRLYIGAWMQETHFWGTLTEDESQVWLENAFEMYAVPDNSMHHYKENQISVMNVTWDLMLKKPYMDREPCTSEDTVRVSGWSSDMEKATYTDGVINDIDSTGTFWSAEWSFSFEALKDSTDRTQATPNDQEAWFFIFARYPFIRFGGETYKTTQCTRPHYGFKIVDGKYAKDETVERQWWSWQPIYTVDLHLPNRFGLVQFKRNMDDKQFHFLKWHVYKALFDVFDAEHKHKSINGMYISELDKLDVPPKLLSTKCVTVTVTLKDGGFQVDVASRIEPGLGTGHIRTDRYVWFT